MVRIEFETNNAAFGETDEDRQKEVVFTLLLLIPKINAGLEAGSIMDINGNRVGSWDISTK